MDNETELNFKKWSKLMEGVYIEEPCTKTIVSCFMILIFVFSLVGNFVTCIVIYLDKAIHTLTNYYVFNLAMSDLLVTFAIPLLMHELYYSNDSIFHLSYGDVACKVHYFLIMVLRNSGILTMTALAVERYIAICRPMSLQSGSVRSRVLKVILIIWIVAIVETTADLGDVRRFRINSMSMCLKMPTIHARILNGVMAILTFIIPLSTMTFVYAMIAFKINVLVVAQNTLESRVFKKKNNSKVNKLIITLSAGFLVCWVPYFTARIWMLSWDANQIQNIEKWWLYVWKFSAFNTWFGAVLNPLLFSIMSSKFQKSLKDLWNRHIRKKRPLKTHDITLLNYT